jgi:hypothetical protein
MSRRLSMLVRSARFPRAFLILALASAAVTAADYETPPTFKASAVLPANRVKGPLFTVSETVKNDGFLNDFHVTTPEFGNYHVQGKTMLLVRLQEIAALGELQKVSKSEVFLKSAGTSVVNVGKGVGKAVTDPVDTAKGIGEGVKRFGVNLGRKSKRAAESVTDDDEKTEGGDKSTEEKAEGAAYSIFGVTGAQRRWAQKVGVDPYSSNKVLRDALQGIGKVDAAGGIAAKVVVPIPMVVSTTASVSNLVWGKDPEELRKLLEKQIEELGASKEVSEAFFKNKVMTPTHWVGIVTALYAVKAKGSDDYIDTAAGAKSEREAVFLSESAYMLQKLHAESPVEALLPDSRVMVARTKDGRALALLPGDYMPWTERLARGANEIGERTQKELGAKTREIWIMGGVSPRARQELKTLGWGVREKTFAR